MTQLSDLKIMSYIAQKAFTIYGFALIAFFVSIIVLIYGIVVLKKRKFISVKSAFLPVEHSKKDIFAFARGIMAIILAIFLLSREYRLEC